MSLSTNLDFLSGALAATSKMEIVSKSQPIPEGYYGETIDIDVLHSHTLTWIGDSDMEVVATKKGNEQDKCTLIVKSNTGSRDEIRKSANEFRI